MAHTHTHMTHTHMTHGTHTHDTYTHGTYTHGTYTHTNRTYTHGTYTNTNRAKINYQNRKRWKHTQNKSSSHCVESLSALGAGR